jgi:hypothetical protein
VVAAGLILAAGVFPLLGNQHVASNAAGVVALVGLVGLFAWAGALLLRAGDVEDAPAASAESPLAVAHAEPGS